MNRIIRKSTTPFSAIAIAVLILITAIAVVVPHVTKAQSADFDSGRLITIHDRGTEKVVVSDAKTIGEALKEA
ncbi:MAG TPA: hypothetical protein VFS65_02580, partial [Candidatus Saccharimonadales bacterium]|nr:hypothetical protein [Candidatus Saccharimonadales bacterium]